MTLPDPSTPVSLLNPSTWEWATIVQTVLGAGAGTAIVQIVAPMLMEGRRRKAHARYLAMRLSVILEDYASKCVDFIVENGEAITPPDSEFPAWNSNLPKLPALPADDEGWRAIDQSLASRILSLPNKIAGSQGVIGAVGEWEPDDLGEHLDEHAAARGLEAWALAEELRRAHDLAPVDLIWDVPGSLRSTAKSAEEDKRKREAAAARNAEALATSMRTK